MSRHNRERRKGKGKGKRLVQVAVVPLTPSTSAIGVSIRREGDDGPAVIAPDEARTIACQIEEGDPGTAAALRDTARAVEQALADPGMPAGALPVWPKITGPHALRDWAERYRKEFRAVYREAVRAGWGAGTVVIATPATESLDDPPPGFDLKSRADARRLLGPVKMGGSLDDPPNPGMFYVVATKASGRFQGTFVGMLPVPGPSEALPTVTALPPPCNPSTN
jgi:hypothetical protein